MENGAQLTKIYIRVSLHSMKLHNIIILFISIVFSGCSTYYYHSPDKTLTDCEKAYQECKYDAMKATASIASPDLGDDILLNISKGPKEGKLIIQCMKLKGYQVISEQRSNACIHK